MARLRPQEFLSLPSLLSLARAPLAVAFPFAVNRPLAALAVVSAAAATDLLDGWCARRLHRATAIGAVLDPVMDKVFVMTVVVTLALTHKLSLASGLCLASRDLLQAPLVLWLALDRRALEHRTGRFKANVFGKIVTALQFVTILAALWEARSTRVLALASGFSGVVAGLSYWFLILRGDALTRTDRAHAKTGSS